MPAVAKPQKTDQLQETFEALKRIYKPFAQRMNVTADTDSFYYLESKTPMFRGKPMCFGMVRKGKGRVAFHLMPLYCFPEMKRTSLRNSRSACKGCNVSTSPSPTLTCLQSFRSLQRKVRDVSARSRISKRTCAARGATDVGYYAALIASHVCPIGHSHNG